MTKVRSLVGVIAFVGLLSGLTGCDWWPPTLQEKIGQQDAQIKALQQEKARLQAKVTELAKTVEDTKTQLAQMEQTTADLKGQVAKLKVSLADAEARAAAKFKPAPAAKRKK